MCLYSINCICIVANACAQRAQIANEVILKRILM